MRRWAGSPSPSPPTIITRTAQPGETLTEEEVIAFCKDRLAPYKVPRMIEFRDELPKSTVGKVLRRVLRDEELAKAKPA